MQSFLIEILKFTLSGILISTFTVFIVKQFFTNSNQNSKIDFTEIDRYKLQALERLMLFIERIRPTEAFVRLYQAGLTAQELQKIIIAEIKAEYSHNITQQLYVNKDTWLIVKRVKDDTITLVNKSFATLPENSTAIELSKIVFSRLDDLDNDPYDLAISVLKSEFDVY